MSVTSSIKHSLLVVGVAFPEKVEDVYLQHGGLTILVHVLDDLQGNSCIAVGERAKKIKSLAQK